MTDIETVIAKLVMHSMAAGNDLEDDLLEAVAVMRDLCNARHGSGGQWAEVIDPIAIKFEIAASFGQNVVFNEEGAEACGKLFREMARIIDTEIASRRTLAGESAL